MMVMELGVIDLAKLLTEKQGACLQPHWTAIHWPQVRQFFTACARTDKSYFIALSYVGIQFSSCM
jgi:hypothetical protein